jgi:hypothetical protein
MLYSGGYRFEFHPGESSGYKMDVAGTLMPHIYLRYNTFLDHLGMQNVYCGQPERYFTSILKIKAEYSFEAWVSIYQTTRRYILGDSNYWFPS